MKRSLVSALSQACQDPHDALHGHPCAMAERAVGLQQGAPARGTVAWPPRASTRMAMGAEVAGAQPAALGTGRMRANMPGGLHLTRAPVHRGHRREAPRRR